MVFPRFLSQFLLFVLLCPGRLLCVLRVLAGLIFGCGLRPQASASLRENCLARGGAMSCSLQLVEDLFEVMNGFFQSVVNFNGGIPTQLAFGQTDIGLAF